MPKANSPAKSLPIYMIVYHQITFYGEGQIENNIYMMQIYTPGNQATCILDVRRNARETSNVAVS